MRYAVIIRRYVEELASIVVEATDSDDAQRQVNKVIEDQVYEPVWGDRNTDDGGGEIEIVDYHPAHSSDELTELPA